jgi:DNA-binding PadR family transcriptional regulator
MPTRTAATEHVSVTEQLSPGDWAVLGLLAESPRHGFAITQVMASDGELGRIWRVRQALVYRTLDVLVKAGLAERAGSQPSTRGPSRTLVAVTPAGRAALDAWLREPAGHVRDLRSVLLLKVALLRRGGHSPVALLHAQRAVVLELGAAIERRIAEGAAGEEPILIWRSEAMQGAVRAIDRMIAAEAPRAG